MDRTYLLYPFITLLRMAIFLSSLVDMFEKGIFFEIILSFFWNQFVGFIHEVRSWMMWFSQMSLHILVAKCWWFPMTLLFHPFWILTMMLQFSLPPFLHTYERNDSRNSFQAIHHRRQHGTNNYNYFRYWYLTAFRLNVVNSSYGTFSSCYAVYPWWSSMLIRFHIQPQDFEKFQITSQVTWTTLDLLNIPYKLFCSPNQRPPDGYISFLLVLLFILLVALASIIHSVIKIITLRIGIVRYYHDSMASPSTLSQTSARVFTSVSVLTAEALAQHKAFASFDSDTKTALIDNCANTHIWTNREDFSNFQPISKAGVSTIGGTPHYALGTGDVITSWKDDNGEIFHHTLTGVLFFPDAPVRIISTSKLATEFGPEIDYEGTYIKSKHSYSVFKWKHKLFRRTIPHPKHCLPEMAVNEGYSSFRSFCTFCTSSASALRQPFSLFYTACATDTSSPSHEVFPIGCKSRYSRDGFTSRCTILSTPSDASLSPIYSIKLTCGRVLTTPSTFLHHIDATDVACVPQTSEDYARDSHNLDRATLDFLSRPASLSDEDVEYLEHHNRLNHLSRDAMYRLACADVIPRKVMKYKTSSPFCASCAFGKAHRRPWCFKGNSKGSIRKPSDNVPGACVSVDQLISAQPGLIPQLSGHLTRARITCATIYVDHFSGFAFSFLQRTTSQEETFADTHGVRIKSFHADNGRFAEASFRNECVLHNQTIRYCAVGAHHQNGIVEAHIKTFTLGARTCLLHSKRLWPEAITTMLWPFALQYYIETYNTFHLDSDGKSPLMKFSCVNDSPAVANYHPFGCPVYILESKLQSNPKGIPKWDPRARLGIYLGHSPVHAGSVALVLNPASGHVSPQYHVVFDDKFSTVPHMRDSSIPPNWEDLVTNSSYCSTDEAYTLTDTWLCQQNSNDDNLLPVDSQPILPPASADASAPSSEGAPALSSEGACVPSSEGAAIDFSPPPITDSPLPVCEGDSSLPTFTNLELSGLRRSSRNRTLTERAKESSDPTVRRMHSFFSLFSFCRCYCFSCSTLCGSYDCFCYSST